MLYRPEQKNYGAIDFFLLERRKLSMFQVKIRNRHDINANELQRFYDDINVGERNLQDYCLFFVLPLGVAMTRKQNFIGKKGSEPGESLDTVCAHSDAKKVKCSKVLPSADAEGQSAGGGKRRRSGSCVDKTSLERVKQFYLNLDLGEAAL